jgi:hypothetical protein
MVEIFRSKFGLRVREAYFASSLMPSKLRRDIDVYIQCRAPIKNGKPFWTALVDLSVEEDKLFNNISKGFRYEIRRASGKDGLTCRVDFSPTGASLEAFISFYEQFSRFRGVRPANTDKLQLLIAKGNLVLSSVQSVTTDLPLVMHCYIVEKNRARLYYSATQPRPVSGSDDKQLIGRANKLLHWETMLEMKRNGFTTYDFGGISKGEALKGIDDFKLQFGGVEQEESNAIVGVSILGHLALGAWKVLGGLMKAVRR